MAMAALLQPLVQGTVVGTDTPLSTQWLLGAVEVTLSFRSTEPSLATNLKYGVMKAPPVLPPDLPFKEDTLH